MNTATGILFERYQPEELKGIFPFLSAEEFQEMCAFLELREWQAGEVVLRSGEPAGFLGFLAAGRLAVKSEGLFPGRFILVAMLERGSLAGEAAVTGGSCQATVTAMENCMMLTLSVKNIALLFDTSPVIGQKLLLRIIHVLGHRLAKANERLANLL